MNKVKKERIRLVAIIAISFSALILSACTMLAPIASDDEDSPEVDSEEAEEIDPAEEAALQLISQEGMMQGIIFQTKDYLVSVDPNSGEITGIRFFKPVEDDVEVTMNSAYNNFQNLQNYNKDLTKKTATQKVQISGHEGVYQHIGWLNTNGEFEDETAKYEQSLHEDDWSAAKEPLSMKFAVNYRDNFLYSQSVDGSAVYRIAINETAPSKLEVYPYGDQVGNFTGGAHTTLDATGVLGDFGTSRGVISSGGFYCMLPSGEHEYTWPEGHQEIEEKHNSAMTQNIVLRWLSADSYLMLRNLLGGDYSTIYLCKRTSDHHFSCETIAPYAEGRRILSSAVSPDNTQVVMQSEQGDKFNLYIAEVDGNAVPQVFKINDEPLYYLGLDEEIDLLHSAILCWSDGSEHPQEAELKYYLDTPECRYQIDENIRLHNLADD